VGFRVFRGSLDRRVLAAKRHRERKKGEEGVKLKLGKQKAEIGNRRSGVGGRGAEFGVSRKRRKTGVRVWGRERSSRGLSCSFKLNRIPADFGGAA
jgi:hypothetical protein